MSAGTQSVAAADTAIWTGAGRGSSYGAYVSNQHATQGVWLTFGGAAAALNTGLLIPPRETVFIAPEWAEKSCRGFAETGATIIGYERINP